MFIYQVPLREKMLQSFQYPTVTETETWNVCAKVSTFFVKLEVDDSNVACSEPAPKCKQ